MSTNVIQTKNLLFPLPPLVARAPLPPAGRPRRSRRAINAFNPLYHVTVQILVVSHSKLSSLSTHILIHDLFPLRFQPSACTEKRGAPMSNFIARPHLWARAIPAVLLTTLQTPPTHLSALSPQGRTHIASRTLFSSPVLARPSTHPLFPNQPLQAPIQSMLIINSPSPHPCPSQRPRMTVPLIIPPAIAPRQIFSPARV